MMHWYFRNPESSRPNASALRRILDDYADLALYHAMKEEMSRLFDLRDGDEARKG